MNKFLASIVLLALTSVALLSMVGPTSGEQTNAAAQQRADCLKQIAQKQQAIEISPEVRERVKEVQPFYDGKKDYHAAPDLPACKKLKEKFDEATQTQFGCPKESLRTLTRSRLFINVLKEADGETKKKFRGYYACEWGRFASQAMSPTIYEAVTEDSTPVFVHSKEQFSSDEETSSFSDTKYDSDDESRFHDPDEHFDFEQTERREECYKGVLNAIKSWVSIDDPSLIKLMQDADKYYGYKGEIPEHGSEESEACEDLLAKHLEVLDTKCFSDRAATGGHSLVEDFAELAKIEPSRFFLESVYACGFGRLSGFELKRDGLFDLVAKPYLEEKRAASSEMA